MRWWCGRTSNINPTKTVGELRTTCDPRCVTLVLNLIITNSIINSCQNRYWLRSIYCIYYAMIHALLVQIHVNIKLFFEKERSLIQRQPWAMLASVDIHSWCNIYLRNISSKNEWSTVFITNSLYPFWLARIIMDIISNLSWSKDCNNSSSTSWQWRSLWKILPIVLFKSSSLQSKGSVYIECIQNRKFRYRKMAATWKKRRDHWYKDSHEQCLYRWKYAAGAIFTCEI
jgi:hypothetical protein